MNKHKPRSTKKTLMRISFHIHSDTYQLYKNIAATHKGKPARILRQAVESYIETL
jgi:predicted DNA-binding protein